MIEYDCTHLPEDSEFLPSVLPRKRNDGFWIIRHHSSDAFPIIEVASDTIIELNGAPVKIKASCTLHFPQYMMNCVEIAISPHPLDIRYCEIDNNPRIRHMNNRIGWINLKLPEGQKCKVVLG